MDSVWERLKYGPLYRLPGPIWVLLCRSTWRKCDGCGRRLRFKRSASYGGGKPSRHYCTSDCRPPEPWWT